VEDAGRLYKEGDTLEAKFVSVDRKNRAITLSIRALEDDAVAGAMEEMSDESKGRTSLGDLLKEKMGK
jgi:small subunit ribosomal protein S1